MGEDATVSDILSRFEMMFGDVDPPHVLLAQFYSLEQMTGEGITDWYSRVEDLASRKLLFHPTIMGLLSIPNSGPDCLMITLRMH